MKGIFITGTDTHVGKTWVSKQLIELLIQQGIDVVPRKPVESGWQSDVTLSDAWGLANAANKLPLLEEVCPNHFEAPLSPDRAALIEGKKLQVRDIKAQCLGQLKDEQFLFVEGAGGFYSPLCSDGLNADLAVLLDLPLLLVVENRLGCINQTLLSIEAIEKRKLTLLAIILNETKLSNIVAGMDNKSDLESLTHYPVISVANAQTSSEPFKEIASLIP